MFRKEVVREGLILLILMALVAFLLLVPRRAGAQQCWRPPIVFHPPATYTPPAYYPPAYYPQYYVKEYVPQVLEVQVYKDRFYSLSDLYRDRLYVEAFDMLREMRQKIDRQAEPEAAATSAPRQRPEVPQAAPQTAPVRKVSYGKTSDKAKELLGTHCFSCHGKGNEHLDLSEMDLVPPTKRWASFGMAAAREMPKPPASKAGEEREKWKTEHGLKDDEMSAIFDGWVNVKSK